MAELDEATLAANLNDPMWRLCNLYRIITKDPDDEKGVGLVIPFRPNRAQRRLLLKLHYRNIILKARQLGFCVDPSTRVLTADLRWVAIADLQPGDEVVAVDEHPPGGRGSSRKMRTATVQAAARVHRKAFRITFDDGRSVVCTAQHPWLSKKTMTQAEWRSLDGTGNNVVGRLKVGTKVRWVAKPWGESTVEDGWFGGMLDGEGSMSKSNVASSVNVSQRHGPVWDRLVRYAEERGYNACIENDAAERPNKFGRVPVPKLAFGRMDELFRLMGQTRPTRFIDRRWWEGRELPGKRNGGIGWSTITSIEELGEQTMIDLQTSTGTYIAEGFVSHNTTLIAILWLDTALFSKSPIRCGIVAHEREAAESIFRDKVVFGYENLPEQLKEKFPLKRKTATEVEFAHNGATVRVATSMRSGTTHRLHISELGKIAAKYPAKAREVLTGSIPSVPQSGITVIESTAEGQDGAFYDMSQIAKASADSRRDLSQKDYRFHFFPWWEEEGYELNPAGVSFTEAELLYFTDIEAKISRPLSAAKRAWYVVTMRSDFAGEAPLMWQEYPSTPEEAFQVSTEGCYYATQITLARKQGRIMQSLPVLAVPVNTFWDIGRGDMTCVWFHQRVGAENRFVDYLEASGEDLAYYVAELQKRGYVYGKHYLPHESSHKRMGESADTNKSIEEMLQGLMPGQRTEVVPRISNLAAGIQATRNQFASAWFDETKCAQGLKRVTNYRKKWDKVRGCWMAEHEHNDDSHGSDALRQWGQAAEAGDNFGGGWHLPTGGPSGGGRRPGRRGRGSAMAV